MGKSFESEVRTVSVGFTKIISGTGALKKISKVYSEFNIPSTENILAYIKSTVPFMRPLIVITDKTIYSYLSDPIPISKVCGYLVVMEDAKASVNMSDADSNRDILGSSLIAKNVAGIEFVQFFRNLQKKLLQIYPWAKQQRDCMVNEILTAARHKMQSGRIPPERLAQLNVIAEEPAYCDRVALLKGEDIFRTCSQSDFQNYISQQNNGVSYASKIILSNSREKFFEALTRDLSDISLDFDNGYLEVAYHNMSELTAFTEGQCLILAYLCARLNKEDQFKTSREQVCRRCGESKAQNIDFFKGQYFNNRMKKVYETIKQGTMPPDEWLDWTDSVGLTVLHYAILLRRELLVDELLKKKEWAFNPPFSDRETGVLYDYTVLACYKGLSNRKNVFQKTSELVAVQLRSRKALERQLWWKQRKLDIQNASVQNMKELMRTARKNGLYDKEEECREKLEHVSMLRAETRKEIDEINQAISEIDYEINILTSDAMVQAADTIRCLQDRTDPLVQYLFRLFSDVDTLLYVISAKQGEFRLYNYDGFYFVAPAVIDIDLPYILNKCDDGTEYSDYQESTWRENQKHQQQENGHRGTRNWKTNGEQKSATDNPITKPYGESWFSPEAHRDIGKLKEEYRSLAKRYHPDVYDHPRSKEIFQSVLNQRAEILEHMSNNMS